MVTDTIAAGLIRQGLLLERVWPPTGDQTEGRSYFGGLPTLPPNVPWPKVLNESLHFILQIDLGELPDFEERGFLPDRGMVYFFMYRDEECLPYGSVSDDRSQRVGRFQIVLYDGDVRSLQPAALPDDLPDIPYICSEWEVLADQKAIWATVDRPALWPPVKLLPRWRVRFRPFRYCLNPTANFWPKTAEQMSLDRYNYDLITEAVPELVVQDFDYLKSITELLPFNYFHAMAILNLYYVYRHKKSDNREACRPILESFARASLFAPPSPEDRIRFHQWLKGVEQYGSAWEKREVVEMTLTAITVTLTRQGACISDVPPPLMAWARNFNILARRSTEPEGLKCLLTYHHQILGNPEFWQCEGVSEMAGSFISGELGHEEARRVSYDGEWRSLLTLGEDMCALGLSIGLGHIYWCIPRVDLLDRRFDRLVVTYSGD